MNNYQSSIRPVPEIPNTVNKVADQQKPVWKRLFLAFFVFVGLCLLSGSTWVFGILMFTFSLDGASSSQLPTWLDAFMLIVWPATVALVPIVPTGMMICGSSWRRVVFAIFATGALAMVVFMVGVVTLFSSL